MQYVWNIYFVIADAGQEAKGYIDQGKLVPDNVMVELILNELHNMRTDSWLLDGKNRESPEV